MANDPQWEISQGQRREGDELQRGVAIGWRRGPGKNVRIPKSNEIPRAHSKTHNNKYRDRSRNREEHKNVKMEGSHSPVPVPRREKKDFRRSILNTP